MTQVFAAINHGLSEEYGKIELPHQEAKTRYVAKSGRTITWHLLIDLFLFFSSLKK